MSSNLYGRYLRKRVVKTKKAILLNLVLVGFASCLLSPARASSQSGYVPNEIIVKFHRTVADKLQKQSSLNAQSPLNLPGELGHINQVYRPQHIKPVFKGFRKKRKKLKALAAGEKSQLTNKQRRILERLKRAPKTAHVPDLGAIYKIHLDIDSPQSLEQILDAYNSSPYVEYAERNYILSKCAEPNDPRFPIQWPLNNTGQDYPESGFYGFSPGTPDSDIDALEAWDINTCSGDIIIAVLDTGVDYNHRDIDDNMWINYAELNGIAGVDDDENNYVDDVYGYDFINLDGNPIDDHGHGTHVAGIIAAEGNNQFDIAGVCWNGRIMALKFLGDNASGDSDDAAAAVYYAVENGADIISNSWTSISTSGNPSHALKDAFDYAHSQGVISVAAAGNSSSSEQVYFPAGLDNVVSVAATNSDDGKGSFSNYGDWVDIAAPGVDILSLRAEGTSQGRTYDDYTTVLSGTSMACPHISAAFATMLSIYPGIDIDEAKDILLQTTDSIAAGIVDSGRLNLFRAVNTTASFAAGTITLDSELYNCSQTIELTLRDLDIAGGGAETVMVTTFHGDSETLILLETAPISGIFTGQITMTTGGPVIEDGMLQVSEYDFVTATYEDQDDGTGNPATVEDIAVADCVPAVVSGVWFEPTGPEPTITFETNEYTTARVLLSESCGGTVVIEKTDQNFSTRHTITLDGVLANTTYYVVIEANDIAGNIGVDDNNGLCYSFTTTGPGDMFVPAQFSTIQDAIDVAWDSSNILVADGIYTGPGNRDIDFRGRTITVRSVKGPSNCIIDCQGSPNEPHRGFFFHNDEEPNSVLAGFTITNGYAPSHFYGGAIACIGSSPTIAGCIITASTAGYGGGISCEQADPIIQNCIITGNRAENFGGGISSRRDALVVINCTIVNNYAQILGGGISFSRAYDTISNSIIYNNFAPNYPQLNSINNPTFTCLSDWTGGGLGNINADPCFASPGYWADPNEPTTPTEPNEPNAIWIDGDYHLLPDSPCINAADPNYPQDQNQTDIDSQPRLFDSRIDMGADEYLPTIEVEMKFTPQTLNPGSNGKWIKAHLVLPETFAIADVDTNTPAITQPGGIGSDHLDVSLNDDNLVEIKASFSRTDFCAILTPDDFLDITVEARLIDGRIVYGTDTIKIVNNPFQQLAALASAWLHTDCSAPDWCGGADLDKNSIINLKDLALLDGCSIEVKKH